MDSRPSRDQSASENGAEAGSVAVPGRIHGVDIIRRLPVNQAVQPQAVVVANQHGRWMINQGLAQIGYPQWHITIYPSYQDTWTGTYQLPAKGKRGIADWMEYAEFHVTSPGSVKHFHYTDQLLPLKESEEARSKSAPWSDPEWATANWIVTLWFRNGDHACYQWLAQYVTDRPGAERAEQIATKNQERYLEGLWELYKILVRERVGRFAAGPPEFQHWQLEVEQQFQSAEVPLATIVQQEAEVARQKGVVAEGRIYQWEKSKAG